MCYLASKWQIASSKYSGEIHLHQLKGEKNWKVTANTSHNTRHKKINTLQNESIAKKKAHDERNERALLVSIWCQIKNYVIQHSYSVNARQTQRILHKCSLSPKSFAIFDMSSILLMAVSSIDSYSLALQFSHTPNAHTCYAYVAAKCQRHKRPLPLDFTLIMHFCWRIDVKKTCLQRRRGCGGGDSGWISFQIINHFSIFISTNLNSVAGLKWYRTHFMQPISDCRTIHLPHTGAHINGNNNHKNNCKNAMHKIRCMINSVSVHPSIFIRTPHHTNTCQPVHSHFHQISCNTAL